VGRDKISSCSCLSILKKQKEKKRKDTAKSEYIKADFLRMSLLKIETEVQPNSSFVYEKYFVFYE
jgi:hypothetical protein